MTRAAGSLRGAHGLDLFRQSWRPDGAPRAAIVIAHGLGEHSDRYDHVAAALTQDGYVVHALDHRGHGRSQGARAVVDVADVVSDLDELVVAVRAEHPGLPVVLLGHSLGGMISVQYAIAHQNRLTGLILSGALATLDAPAALRAIGRVLSAVAPTLGMITLDAELVSRDPQVVAAYRADPLVHHGRIPARTASQIFDTTSSFPGRIGAITLPVLVMYGTADGLCPTSGSIMLAEGMGSSDVTVRAYEGLYHEILNEPEQGVVIGDVRRWLAERLGGPVEPAAAVPPTAVRSAGSVVEPDPEPQANAAG